MSVLSLNCLGEIETETNETVVKYRFRALKRSISLMSRRIKQDIKQKSSQIVPYGKLHSLMLKISNIG